MAGARVAGTDGARASARPDPAPDRSARTHDGAAPQWGHAVQLPSVLDNDERGPTLQQPGHLQQRHRIGRPVTTGTGRAAPAQDLALLVAAQRLKRLKERPTPKELRALAEPWSPYRSYAARMLWHYYRNAPPL